MDWRSGESCSIGFHATVAIVPFRSGLFRSETHPLHMYSYIHMEYTLYGTRRNERDQVDLHRKGEEKQICKIMPQYEWKNDRSRSPYELIRIPRDRQAHSSLFLNVGNCREAPGTHKIIQCNVRGRVRHTNSPS